MRARVAVTVCGAAMSASAIALVRCSDGGASADAGEEYGIWHPPDGAGADAPQARDAGPDVDPCTITSDWPGFRRLTEFDPCAPADVLADEDAGYNMAWTDCDDAAPSGCKQLAQVYPQAFTVAYATYDDAGSGETLFLDQGIDPVSTVRQFDIIDLKSSTRLGEWRIDADKSNGTEIVLANAHNATTAFLGWKPTLLTSFGPAKTLASNLLNLTPCPSAPLQDINWAISDQIMAWQPLASPYAICRVDAGTCVPMNIASISPAEPYLTFAWHDVAFAVAEHGTSGWAQEYVIHADGSISLLRSNPNAHIWGMTTDGITLVWEETYGSTNFLDAQTTTEIWKAPFTTDKSTLDATATKLVTLPTAGIGGANLALLDFFNGLYATALGGPNTIYVVDVMTAQVQQMPVGPGGIILGLPYVDRNELWEITRTVSYQDYLVRIPFAQAWK